MDLVCPTFMATLMIMRLLCQGYDKYVAVIVDGNSEQVYQMQNPHCDK